MPNYLWTIRGRSTGQSYPASGSDLPLLGSSAIPVQAPDGVKMTAIRHIVVDGALHHYCSSSAGRTSFRQFRPGDGPAFVHDAVLCGDDFSIRLDGLKKVKGLSQLWRLS